MEPIDFQKRLLKDPLGSVCCAAIQSHDSLRIREFFLCIQGIRRVLQVLNLKQAPMALSVSSPQTLRNSSISWQFFLIFWIVCSSLPILQIFFGFPSEIHILSGSPDITPIFVIFLDEENEQLTVQPSSSTITTRVPIQRRLKDKTCEASKTDGTQTHSRVRGRSILRSMLSTFTLVEQPHDTRRERCHAVSSLHMRSLVPWKNSYDMSTLHISARETHAVNSHLDLIVDGANAVDSIVVRSKIR